MTTDINADELLELVAPKALTNYRVRRYLGDDFCLSMGAFTEDDQSRLRQLYGYLLGLMAVLAPTEQGSSSTRLKAHLQAERLTPVVEAAMKLGLGSYALTPTPAMAKVIHDLRGGGLTPLLGQLQLAELGRIDEATVDSLYFLTRDHLKIMRNALVGLDDAKRREDLIPKIHSTDFIVQKWQGAALHSFEREVRLEVDCPQSTAISECCVEFGALDRILYNLINNACRHTASDSIRLIMRAAPNADGDDLCFVLLNAISEKDHEHLRGVPMNSLFEVRTSTTGSGYGLAIATDFVSNAYGLRTPMEAVEGGYMGARLVKDCFAAWFHWPRVLED